jgi:hypothetical protein
VEKIRQDLASAPMMALPKQGMSTQPFHGFAPEGGWPPDAFPQLTFAPISYTTDPLIRPDPRMHINEEGWLYVEAGNTRMAIPDREEWAKFVHMGEAMFNTHERQIVAASAEPVAEDEPEIGW